MAKSSSERLGPLVERVRAQAAEFVMCDSGARAADAEAIHRMRIATRRTRGCLRTFRGAFVIAPTQRLDDELTWFAGVLGDARDAQVILARIPPQDRGWTEQAQRDLADAEAALTAAMDLPRYRELVGAVAVFAITPPFVEDAKGERWMVRRLVKEIERTKRRVAAANALSGSERSAALHVVRKAAKRTRYAAETLEPVYGKKARRVARAFEGIQTVLGEHRDSVVVRSVLEDADAGHGDGFDHLIVAESERAHRADEQFVAEWEEVVDLVKRHWPVG